MRFRKIVAATATSLLMAVTPVHAGTVAEIGLKVGQPVFGPQGNEVGKIETISGETVIINTGTHRATLSGAHFAKSAQGPRIGFTRPQLEQAVDAALQAARAKVDALLVAGNPLRSSDGVALGTVKSINDDGSVVIEGPDRTFALQRNMFSNDDKGLTILMSSQQLSDALERSRAEPQDSAAAPGN